jgi:ankyrin repeat protein
MNIRELFLKISMVLVVVFTCPHYVSAEFNVTHATAEELSEEVGKLLFNEDFAALDEIGEEILQKKLRFASGDWMLERFNYDVQRGCWDELGQRRLAKYKEQIPRSAVPLIAQASYRRAQGLAKRGAGFVESVTMSEMDGLQAEMSIAWSLLLEAEKLAPKNPHLYVEMIEVAKLHQTEEVFKSVFKKAVSVESAYYPLYTTYGRFLLPQWGGTFSDIEVLAQTASDQSNEEGEAIYAKVATYFAQMFRERFYDDLKFSWERINSGFKLLEKRFPDSVSNLNAHAYLACLGGDRNLAKVLFVKIGNRVQLPFFDDQEFTQRWKNWANSSGDILPDPLALHKAVTSGDTLKINEIIKGGVSIETTNTEGLTPLQAAAHWRQADAAATLIKLGASVNSSKTDFFPLDYAIGVESEEITALLITAGANVNAKNKRGWYPILSATNKRNVPIIKLLLAQPILDVNVRLEDGRSALNIALYNQRYDIARMLLANMSLEVNTRGGSGHWSPLHLVVWNRNAEFAKILLDRGADVEAQTDDGRTPRSMALSSGDQSLISIFSN